MRPMEFSIEAFTPEKRKLRSLMTMFNLFITKNKKQNIHDSVSHSGKIPIQEIYTILDSMVEQISEHTRMTSRTSDTRYRDMIRTIGEFFLYIYGNDTAFMDMGDYFLLQLYQPEHAIPILEYLSKHQPDIKNCYFNTWEKFKQETRDMEDKGLLQRGQLCPNEMLLVNSEIAKKVKKYGEREKNKG